jgi:RNA polymerase sigma-70 factor (ECF subfamily)
VAALPIAQRVVVILYYVNDLSVQSISEIVGVPPGTVKSRLHYGRRQLKAALEVHGLRAEALPELVYETL